MVGRWDGVGDGVVVGVAVVYGSNVAFPKEYNEKLKQIHPLFSYNEARSDVHWQHSCMVVIKDDRSVFNFVWCNFFGTIS